MSKIKEQIKSSKVSWESTIGLLDSIKVDEIGVKERVSSLSTRSIKRESKLQALNYIVSSAAAVCVYPSLVSTAKEIIGTSNVKVASVSSYFPSGQVPIESKLLDTQYAIDEGADEIDIVINRKAFFEGDYRKVFDEIVALKEACGDKHLKTILEVGELRTYDNIKKASLIALGAGSDFIKTSTGKISNGSSKEACLVMAKAVYEFKESTGFSAGIKVAGGIRNSKDAIRYLIIIKEELGEEWLSPNYFRFGASSLLDDVLRQIRKLKTNAYQSSYYFPRG